MAAPTEWTDEYVVARKLSLDTAVWEFKLHMPDGGTYTLCHWVDPGGKLVKELTEELNGEMEVLHHVFNYTNPEDQLT